MFIALPRQSFSANTLAADCSRCFSSKCVAGVRPRALSAAAVAAAAFAAALSATAACACS